MSGGYAALARGEADGLEKSLFRPQALSTVRYADPAAWAVATATPWRPPAIASASS
jgi:hypothetical protein